MTTFKMPLGPNMPVGGGGYLRLFPMPVTRMGVGRAQDQGLTLITYLHPWEIDPQQPRLPGRLLSRIRHYNNLSKMAGRLESLARQVDFRPFTGSTLIENAPLLKDRKFWEASTN